MNFVRYGIPGILVLAGFVCLFAAPEGSQAEGFALFTGAGLSVLLLNVLFRIGVTADEERPRRQWRQPENIATPESEAAERERSGN